MAHGVPDATADGQPGGAPRGDEGEVLEVRVVALGAADSSRPDGSRWLAMGRLRDGTSVTFVIDARTAERVSDAMASGEEPLVVIERRQIV